MKRSALPLLLAVATATCGHAARSAPRSPDPGPAGDDVALSTTATDGQEIFDAVGLTQHACMPGEAMSGSRGAGQGMGMMHGRMGQGGMQGAGAGMGMMHGQQDPTARAGMGMMHGQPMAGSPDTTHRTLMGMGAVCPMHHGTPPDTGAAPVR